MIVLDTNILSEALKTSPSVSVMQWLASVSPETAFTSSITQAEMLRGVELLPSGRRKSLLASALDKIFLEEFQGRIIPFDDEAAPFYAAISVARARARRPISQSDAMIAAVCRSRGATLATRNTSDFEGCGVGLVDPWQHRAR